MMNDLSSPGLSEREIPQAQDPNDLVLSAMRLAEWAHRTREGGPHHRKAPKGEDRPAYFIHLTEVAWMLQDAGYAPAVVAAGFLHDLIEDCEYTEMQLASEINNDRVAKLVAAVSEPDKGHGWEKRNETYLRNIKNAQEDVLALSCADKTSNLRDMNRLIACGYLVQEFTSRGHATQLKKFEDLDAIYRSKVPSQIYQRYSQALAEFRNRGK